MDATLQVNDSGSWRNVARYDLTSRRFRAVLRGARLLAKAAGPRPKWRLRRDHDEHVIADDEAIRSGVLLSEPLSPTAPGGHNA